MEHTLYLLEKKEVHFKPSKNLRLGNICCDLTPTEPSDEVNTKKCKEFGKLLERKLLCRKWLLDFNFKFDLSQIEDTFVADVDLKGALLNSVTEIVSFTDSFSAPPVLTLVAEFSKCGKEGERSCLNQLMTGFETDWSEDGSTIFVQKGIRVDHRCVEEVQDDSPCAQDIFIHGEGPTSYDMGNDHWKMVMTLAMGVKEAPDGTMDTASDSQDEDSWDDDFPICARDNEPSWSSNLAMQISNIKIHSGGDVKEGQQAARRNSESSEEDWLGSAGPSNTTTICGPEVFDDYYQDASDENSETEPVRPIRKSLRRVGPPKVLRSDVENKVDGDGTIAQKQNKKRKIDEDEPPDSRSRARTLGDS